ncbi:MAG TPA: hypothetical protein VF240_04500 [Pyrinomonadaceae bacterium]
MNRLRNPSEIETAARRIAALLDARGEWFCAEGRGAERPSALRRGEWEVSAQRGALLLSYWGAGGARVWRVRGWEWRGGKLLLEATRRAGAVRATLELVPRASAAADAAELAAARRAECERLAALLCESVGPGARIEEARLSAGARRGEPGRYARILLRRGRETHAATGPIVELGSEEAGAFVASALLWFAQLGSRRAGAPRGLLLFGPRKLSAAAAELVSLLRAELRGALEVYELGGGRKTFERVREPDLEELLDASPRLSGPARADLTETAARIRGLAPEAIDVVRARHGETLRFRGLAFARVRRLPGGERAWFGVEGVRQRRSLDASSWPDLPRLVGELEEHRRAGGSAGRHALYRAAPEAWLESLLRRDVTRLDPGLVVSPVHAQFRTTRGQRARGGPIDLLALRRDGRLVVIELKVSEDAALPLQGAQYWRRISTHHRAGHITRARLFGNAEISDDPPLVYLVAPLLRFHRSFQTLARAVTPEIEMYRFDLNEDWRAGVRVARRARIG